MTLLAPWGLLAGLLALPVLALHVLRARRRTVDVASTFLWADVARPVAPSRLWERLRWSLPLLFQLLTVALLTTALARPAIERRVPFARHTVFLVDVSASMGARDGSPDRVGAAVERIAALRRDLPDGGRASLVAVDAQPRVLLSTSDDANEFVSALRSLRATYETADVAAAATLAQGLQSADADTGFVFVSDGRVAPELARLLPPGTVYERIGSSGLNRAVTRVSVEPRGSGLHARVTVRNASAQAAQPTLRIDVDGRTAARTVLDLEAGATIVHEADLPAGERVTALLDQPGGQADLLDIDDRGYAVAGQRRAVRVGLYGPQDADAIFVERALGAIPNVTVERVEGETGATRAYDLVVLDRVDAPASGTSGPVLTIAPPGGFGTVKVVGRADDPAITFVRTDDALLAGLDLADVVVASAQRVEAPDADVLVGSPGAPLVVRGSSVRNPYVYIAFDPAESSLPLDVAWPVMVDRLVTELTGSVPSAASFDVGAAPDLAGGRAFAVEGPGDRRSEVRAGGAIPTFDVPGFWTVTPEGAPARTVAVNAPASEADLRPEQTMAIERLPAKEVGPGGRAARTFLPWIICALMIVMLGEWWSARRRIGVTRQQWRIAQVVRVGAAFAALVALVAPVASRSANNVATVFVVDASDSLGPAGRVAALRTVEEALAVAPDDARAGVVVFGGTARVAAAVRERLTLSGATITVDSQRTDLAGALRLAGAVAPRDAASRIVVVSDGRRTQGDELAAAQELASARTRVDVIPIGPARASDVAVTGIDLPRRARAGERVTLRVGVSASAGDAADADDADDADGAVSATREVPITVRADGEVVARRTVTVAPGESVVEVPVIVTGAGVARYEVEVGTGADAVPQNDLAYAALSIDGPARVLVIEGIDSRGAAVPIVRALTAGGLVVDERSVSTLPALEELVGTSGIVLVDVSARELTAANETMLTSAVRELGLGLTVIGGTRSYGTGGYLGSDLEQLLPVVSEVLDPRRRKTVAQVLAIDTSGSMAACHCANPGDAGAPRPDGGIVKTDLARSAAAAAIDSMQASDEVGVLSLSDEANWVIDLGPKPSPERSDAALRSLRPDGATKLLGSLRLSAQRLQASKAALKHIVLFTDGFTPEGNFDPLVAEARELRDAGITVSVVGTGEGAADQLERVADAGGGRFYEGRDLTEIPRIFVEESQVVARSLVNEGSFLPEVTSSVAPVRSLREAPALLGFQATTAKPTARTLLRIGPERDPLAASWQAGLGRVTAWTSDGGARWAAPWAGWDGAVDFWSGLVKDTFSVGGPGQVTTRLDAGRLEVRVVADTAWPDGSTARAGVRLPDGTVRELELERTADDVFVGSVEAPLAGTYSAGATVSSGSSSGSGGAVFGGGAVANRGYSAEYRPGPVERDRLIALSNATGGRGVITPDAAFDRAGLIEGRRSVRLRSPLLWAALLGFVVAVALWRLPLWGRVGLAAASSPSRGASARIGRLRGAAGRPRAAAGGAAVGGGPAGGAAAGGAVAGGAVAGGAAADTSVVAGEREGAAEGEGAAEQESSLDRMLERTRRTRNRS